ncbi:unnamed protein product [Didymodactylos carnosus]|uniref:Uncharacterized protein n=1 Tax=Didymodactylos carnosus TaxID=1234261 RepID=A0A813Q3W0_9BILA|nr:unnamed protein product [Didymodactylos carnosus]CAF0925480.1 unnamed protein product [Didymodactylos carnosus]CAF3542535.1 unnamed protein product [Didymodactylos carnosus]CAF3702592.1 unnamed protein product [Didymodactylos carnosus]
MKFLEYNAWMFHQHRIIKAICLLLLLFITEETLRTYVWYDHDFVRPSPRTPGLSVNFTGFDNVSGVNYYLVPNVIHIIRFNKKTFDFVDVVCLRAAYRAQKPDKFVIHTNEKEFEGKYWLKLQTWPDLFRRIEIKYRAPPTKIFGQSLSKDWQLHHGSDIERVRILIEYGGIWMDNDVYIVQNLDRYRKFEMVLNWDENQFLATQLYLAHKDARFLPLYLETYRQYRSNLWYYNAGERPTQEILYKHPELIHRVKNLFGADTSLSYNLYNKKNWTEWRNQHAIHLLFNHRSYMHKENYQKYPVLDEKTILDYKQTFGEMAREAYFSE